MSAVAKEIGERLARHTAAAAPGDVLDAAACKDLIARLNVERLRLQARRQEISPAIPYVMANAGVVWTLAAESGDGEQIEALRKELGEVVTSLEMLRMQETRLAKRRETALIEEAVQGLPKKVRSLRSKLDAAEAALAAAIEKRSELERMVNEIGNDRATVLRATGACAPVPDVDVQRYVRHCSGGKHPSFVGHVRERLQGGSQCHLDRPRSKSAA